MLEPPIAIIARVCREHYAAVRSEHLDDNEHDAIAAADAALVAKARETWARPVQSFDDVLIRALLAREFSDQDEAGNLEPPKSDMERSIAELIESVLTLARRHGADA